MENQVKSKYLWVFGLKVCLEGMETVYRMWDLLELLLDIKSLSPLMVEKSYSIPNKFPASPKVKEEVIYYCCPFCCPLPHSYINESRLLTNSHQKYTAFSLFMYRYVKMSCSISFSRVIYFKV